MAVGDVYKCTLIGQSNEAPCVLVFHYEVVTSAGAVNFEIASLLNALDEVFFKKTIIDDLLDLIHNTYFFTSIQVRDVHDPTSGGDMNIEAPRDGLLGGGQIPQQACMLARKGTGLIGRSYRGRNYLPTGNTVSLTDQGRYDQAFADRCLDFYSNLDIIIDPAIPFNFIYKLVVYSETLDVASEVTDFSIVRDPRSQVRRAH